MAEQDLDEAADNANIIELIVVHEAGGSTCTSAALTAGAELEVELAGTSTEIQIPSSITCVTSPLLI